MGLAFYFGKPFIQPSAPMLPSIPLGFWSDIPQIRSAFNINALFLVGVVLAFAMWWAFANTALGPGRAHDRRFRRRRAGHGLLGRHHPPARHRLRRLPGRRRRRLLSLYYPGSWNERISSGQGLMAVALVIFARWHPLYCFMAALLFGGAGALGPALQAVGVTQGYYLFYAAPYVLTLVIMVLTSSASGQLKGAPGELSIYAMTNAEHYVAADPYRWPWNGDLRPDNTALIIIDMQTDFCGEGGYVDRMGYDLALTRAPIEPIKAVLAAMRGSGYHDLPYSRGSPPRPRRPAAQQALALAADRRRHRRSRARAAASWCAASRAGTSFPSWRRCPASPSSTSPARARSVPLISS